MPSAPTPTRYPLSPEQESLWFLERIRDGSPCDHIVQAFRLRGALDRDALARSVAAIVARHDALRTTFEVVGGSPRLRVHASMRVDVERLDPATGDAEATERGLSRRFADAARRRFDLERGPLLRVGLTRLDEDDHALLLVVHHIVFDGRSLDVVLGELERLYAGFRDGGEGVVLAEPPIRHADHAARRRARLDDGTFASPLARRAARIAAEGVPSLELPARRPRPPRQTPFGARRPVTIPGELCTRLAALGRGEGATLFMTVLAAFQALLYRCTGQRRIAVGTPMTLRDALELESLVGLLVNMVVPSVEVSGELPFRALLGRARAAMIETYAEREVPLDALVAAVRPERDLSRNPLFQVMLQLSPRASFRLPGLDVEPFAFDPGTSQLDLSVHLFGGERVPGGHRALTGHVEYDTDLFDEADIDALIARFERLLRDVVARPDGPIADLDLLATDERRRLLVDWQGRAVGRPSGETIHRLFERQVARAPDAVALRDGERTLDFAELDRCAERLAGRIAERLAEPLAEPLVGGAPDEPGERRGPASPPARERRGTVVGVCIERSAGAVIALLAVLKSGGAYLALDPDHPRDRLTFVLRDSGARLLLAEERLAARFDGTAVPTLLVDGRGEPSGGPADGSPNEPSDRSVGSAPGVEPAPAVEPDDAASAYVVYTSGSTGVPKGVVGTHRGAINRMRWMWESYPFAAGDVAVQKTALGFVDHVWEVFGPLLRGVPLVVIGERELREPALFVDTLAREGVTHLSLVPSLLRVVLETEPALGERLPRLRCCTSSGETLPPDLAARFLEAAPRCRLLNLYGSSEVAADVTAHEVGAADVGTGASPSGSVPIGRPIANVRLYVLDRDGRLLPCGLPGELHVGGVALSEGYLGRPERAAERFVPDPFGPSAGARLFRTGDIVRYRADGVLDFVGRGDRQVKVRGVRVDPGEVETALRDLPEVAEAAVGVRDDGEGPRRLIAHVVARSGHEPTADGLREALRRRLPDAMLPRAFHVLDALPLTPSGKVDRGALRDAAERPDTVRRDRAMTPRERLIGDLWCRLLGRDEVSSGDNFFDIGGDSLLAMMFVAHANRTGLSVSAGQLFEHQSVAALAAAIGGDATDAATAAETAAAADRSAESDPFPLVPGQARFLARGPVGVHRWNLAVRLEAREALDPEALRTAIAALVARHAALRSRLVLDAVPLRQRVAGVETALPFRRVELSGLGGASVDEAIEREIERLHATLHLARGPVFRVAHFTGGGRRDQLALVLHHLVCDRYSLSVLVADLEAAYREAATHGRVRPRAEPTPLRRWAEWLERYARSAAGEADAGRWLQARRHDAGALPRDRRAVPGENVNLGARTVSVTLDEEETRALVDDRSYPLHERLLAALHGTLSAWTGSDAVLVDLMHHGRDVVADGIDLSGTVGMLISYTPLPLAVDPASDDRLSVLSGQIRALPSGSWSFGALHDHVDSERTARALRRLPKAEVLFNHHGPLLPSDEGALFETVPGGHGDGHDPRGRREHLLAVQSSIDGRSLNVRFVYNVAFHREETVREVARTWLRSLRSLA